MNDEDVPVLTEVELKIVESGYCPNPECDLLNLVTEPLDDKLQFNYCLGCKHIYITQA